MAIKRTVYTIAWLVVPPAVVAFVSDLIDKPAGRSYWERFVVLFVAAIAVVTIMTVSKRSDKDT